jgi:hypothetical protein
MVLASRSHGITIGNLFPLPRSIAIGGSPWLWLGLALAALALAHTATSCLFLERRRNVWLSQLPTYHVDTRETINGVSKAVSDERGVASALVSCIYLDLPPFLYDKCQVYMEQLLVSIETEQVCVMCLSVSPLSPWQHYFFYPDSPHVSCIIDV